MKSEWNRPRFLRLDGTVTAEQHRAWITGQYLYSHQVRCESCAMVYIYSCDPTSSPDEPTTIFACFCSEHVKLVGDNPRLLAGARAIPAPYVPPSLWQRFKDFWTGAGD